MKMTRKVTEKVIPVDRVDSQLRPVSHEVPNRSNLPAMTCLVLLQ